MSSFIQKIRKAKKVNSTFRFTPCHLQSSEFMQNNVIYCRYTVPTDHFKIRPVLEGRCAPLVNPSFINTYYHIRAFYVPHSIIWKRFDDWVNGNSTLINGTHYSTDIPIVTDSGLTSLLITYTNVSDHMNNSTFNTTDKSHSYDFILRVGSDDLIGYKLNNKGRFIYKLLRSLGYKINFTNDSTTSDSFNALALLSYFRVFLDYFIPATWYESSACNILLSKCYNPTSQVNVSSLLVDLKNAFEEVYENFYPTTYETASWQQPQSPRGSNLDNIYSNTGALSEFSDILSKTSGATISVANTAISGVESTGLTSSAVTSYNTGNPWVQRNLQKIADWLTRTRFVGTDKMLNILARFGVKPGNELSLRSKFCGSFKQPLVVQDINSMASTEGAPLGEYAGKMFTQASKTQTFDIKSDDYGCIIITSMISPADIHYYQGQCLDHLKVKPLQFYQPEFDSMGTQLQSIREIVSGFHIATGDVRNDIAPFTYSHANGHVPRYSEYKTEQSNLSGDFACPTLNTILDTYHHFRGIFKYGIFSTGGTDYENSVVPNTGPIGDKHTIDLSVTPTIISAQSNWLCRAEDKNQYNRIFNSESNVQDHIYTMYYFDIVASRPMIPISDTIDIEEGSSDKIDTSKDVIENFK